ncbi:MAG: domain, G-beta repeat [Gemmataceae bacterium]|nr:domain, G-beta repeat [Gemmataceae bacterium]
MKSPSPDTLKQVKDFSRPATVFAIAPVPGTERAFLGCQDFKVYEAEFSAAKFEPKELYAHESYVTGVAVAGKVVVSGGYDGKLTWWDTVAGKVVRTVDAHAKWIRKVISSPDGKLVASIADDMVCKLWDPTSGKLIRELRGHKEKTPQNFGSMLYAVAFSADGKFLATGDKVGHVVVWDVESGQQLATCEVAVMYTWDPVQRMHSIGGVRSVAFSPDGKQLAVGGTGKIGNIDHLEAKGRIEVFDWRAGKQTAEFPGDKHQGIVNRLAWAPDGSWLVGAGGAGEGFLIFLDGTTKKPVRQEKLPMHVHDFALSADCSTITSVGHNRIQIHKLG